MPVRKNGLRGSRGLSLMIISKLSSARSGSALMMDIQPRASHAADKFGFRATARSTSEAPRLRVPMKRAMHSNSKPAGYSDRKPATLGVNRMGRFDDVVEGREGQ